jgi:predicted GIY-YIG superfamily endonuclease/3-methyladenine DNA glycosylase AlkD
MDRRKQDTNTRVARESTAKMAQKRLRSFADPEVAAILARFFKTGPGQYGEGDRFIGVKVPTTRKVAREFKGLLLPEVECLLHSEIHEERLLALVMLVGQFEKGNDTTRKRIFDLYLANTEYINNWDLVDLSAPQVVGGYLENRSRKPLDRLAKSASLWERRISILATHWFIRHGDFDDTFRIAGKLLGDKEDLIHKAVGWMLREVGKRDVAVLEEFLGEYCEVMPRTMLRYAIERLPEQKRQRYLNGEAAVRDNAWFLYLLRCADGSLYTGITNNVSRRCQQHNAGTASRYTRSRLPVELVYQESQASRSVALKRELAVKAMSRQEKESLIRPER